MEDQASYRESHIGKGLDDGQRFSENQYRAFMWALERQVLRSILHKHFSTHKPTVLDFACGTGRIMLFLEE